MASIYPTSASRRLPPSLTAITAARSRQQHWTFFLVALLVCVASHPSLAASRKQCRIACTAKIASCRAQAPSRRERRRCKPRLMQICRTTGIEACQPPTTTTTPTLGQSTTTNATTTTTLTLGQSTTTTTTTTTPSSSTSSTTTTTITTTTGNTSSTTTTTLPCGTFLTTWGSSGTGDGQFNYPEGVVVDGSGNVYVADSFNNRIQKFTSTGTFLTTWGSSGTGDGQFNYAVGVATDGSGNVYVADYGNNRIQKFDGNGTFLTGWGGGGSGSGQFSTPHLPHGVGRWRQWKWAVQHPVERRSGWE